MAPLGLGVSAVGVGDQLEVAKDPAQPGWVQPTGRLDQHRFGLHSDLVGQVLGAVGHHCGVGDRDIPTAQRVSGGRQGAAEQGPGGPDGAGGGAGAQTQPGP